MNSYAVGRSAQCPPSRTGSRIKNYGPGKDKMLKNKLCVAVHFVWATWDRHPLISEEIERDLWRYLETVCVDDGCEVLMVGGMPDHVHLLVLLSNTITLADLMKHIKGGSSAFVSDKLRPGEWFKWQGSYGAFSRQPPANQQRSAIHRQSKTASR